ncbi:hypothetical protein N9W41_00190 [bacterium]|nr:hypothetical protein [bacterium]
MGLTNAQLEYVTEVLGVKEVVRPAGFSEPVVAPTPALVSGIVVVTDVLSADEKVLLDKMLASVKLSGHSIVEIQSESDLSSLNLGPSSICLNFSSRFANATSQGASYQFDSLKDLNDASDLNKQKALKMKAWTMLKGVKH